MRALKYKLVDGSVVSTLSEARNSKKSYSMVVEDIPEAPSSMGKVRRAILDRDGVCY